MHPGSRSTDLVRRFRGPVADEIHVLCRPADSAADAATQAESLYRTLLASLESEGAGAADLVTETVFFRRIEDADLLRAAAARVLGGAEGGRCVPSSTMIGQAPLDGAAFELAAVARIPRVGGDATSRLVVRRAACGCPACSAGQSARVLEVGEQTHVHAGGIHGRGASATGRGGSAFDEAFAMFCEGEALLREAGMDFRDVVRTWIQLRDIDRDYEAFNQARREFFASRGVERRPASTGVQGIPDSAAHDFTLGFQAVRAPKPLEAPTMSTPTLNEAWTYGADFSRGLRLADANKVVLQISGTASIDEEGRSVHVGDFRAQAERMLLNIRALLEQQGAGFDDLVSAVTYLKRPQDVGVLREIYAAHGFRGFPGAIVDAPLCRPELLCEAEAVALLPLGREARGS
ncbi:MAG TPA: RidA family protein [Candidatus Binatia bacterium]